MRRLLAFVLAAAMGLAVEAGAPGPQAPAAPASTTPLKVAVLGDNGNGKPAQYEVGERLWAERARFPYELVLMLGDNMYGSQDAEDFERKFALPYAPILAAGVPFQAVLGNHDHPENVYYPGFNMGGRRYYTFARRHVRFVMLDSNQVEPEQIAWLDRTLGEAAEPWKVVVFHHPIYSDGNRHGSDVELRVVLEPIIVRHRVEVVFSGHEHFYQRIAPQKGVTYFISGAGAQLRKGGCTPTALNAAYFDQDQSFMLVEFGDQDMQFRAISRTGVVVDAGRVVRRRGPVAPRESQP